MLLVLVLLVLVLLVLVLLVLVLLMRGPELARAFLHPEGFHP